MPSMPRQYHPQIVLRVIYRQRQRPFLLIHDHPVQTHDVFVLHRSQRRRLAKRRRRQSHDLIPRDFPRLRVPSHRRRLERLDRVRSPCAAPRSSRASRQSSRPSSSRASSSFDRVANHPSPRARRAPAVVRASITRPNAPSPICPTISPSSIAARAARAAMSNRRVVRIATRRRASLVASLDRARRAARSTRDRAPRAPPRRRRDREPR